MALLEAGYIERKLPGLSHDGSIDWTPRETILERFIELGLGEQLIRAMVFDFKPESLAASEAIDGLEILHTTVE